MHVATKAPFVAEAPRVTKARITAEAEATVTGSDDIAGTWCDCHGHVLAWTIAGRPLAESPSTSTQPHAADAAVSYPGLERIWAGSSMGWGPFSR